MLRAYHPADRAAVASICLHTADAGADATGLLPDDRLWADLFALPYVELELELAFVVELAGEVVGYVLGTADSAGFAVRVREHWLPQVAGRYPPGPRTHPREDSLVRRLHEEPGPALPALRAYPAHLHIDLLPPAQGHGWGRRLISRFAAAVAERGATGVHVGVHPANLAALGFYRRLGFVDLVAPPGVALLGAATDALV